MMMSLISRETWVEKNGERLVSRGDYYYFHAHAEA